jgi:hypothetical protein
MARTVSLSISAKRQSSRIRFWPCISRASLRRTRLSGLGPVRSGHREPNDRPGDRALTGDHTVIHRFCRAYPVVQSCTRLAQGNPLPRVTSRVETIVFTAPDERAAKSMLAAQIQRGVPSLHRVLHVEERSQPTISGAGTNRHHLGTFR